MRFVEEAKRWLEQGVNSRFGELERLTLSGLKIVRAEPGRVLCSFVVPKSVTDSGGNWQPGAIATAIDDIGAAAILSSVGQIKVSVDFAIFYFSTAKIDEEVEIEGRVLGHKGKLSSMIVEIRKKDSGDMVALGKQWMTELRRIPSKI